ncbi:MAG: ADP-ribosylglycohydrolase family protein [Opitutaceae bacterium]
MTELDQRRAGLLFGSFTAEALSLGVHWIYDTKKLAQKYESITEYHAPGADSHHPKKQAGDQSHLGDQGLVLANFLTRERRWDKTAFMKDWVSMWANYDDYFDHATKTTLSNIKRGVMQNKAGSESSELAGPARSTPLIAFLADEDESVVLKATEQQTELTHNSREAFETSHFLTTASYQLMRGADLQETIEATAPAWVLNSVRSVRQLDSIKAIDELGQSCSIRSALPAVVFLIQTCGDDLPKAFEENAKAGGDNCARALALGTLLGASHGIEAIPKEWIEKLNAKKELDALLKASTD